MAAPSKQSKLGKMQMIKEEFPVHGLVSQSLSHPAPNSSSIKQEPTAPKSHLSAILDSVGIRRTSKTSNQAKHTEKMTKLEPSSQTTKGSGLAALKKILTTNPYAHSNVKAVKLTSPTKVTASKRYSVGPSTPKAKQTTKNTRSASVPIDKKINRSAISAPQKCASPIILSKNQTQISKVSKVDAKKASRLSIDGKVPSLAKSAGCSSSSLKESKRNSFSQKSTASSVISERQSVPPPTVPKLNLVPVLELQSRELNIEPRRQTGTPNATNNNIVPEEVQKPFYCYPQTSLKDDKKTSMLLRQLNQTQPEVAKAVKGIWDRMVEARQNCEAMAFRGHRLLDQLKSEFLSFKQQATERERNYVHQLELYKRALLLAKAEVADLRTHCKLQQEDVDDLTSVDQHSSPTKAHKSPDPKYKDPAGYLRTSWAAALTSVAGDMPLGGRVFPTVDGGAEEEERMLETLLRLQENLDGIYQVSKHTHAFVADAEEEDV